ncbi:MAG TPA: nitroreductase/quinone reductase family protein [Acidimicrobiales bacterium]|nr:nitroreductase/quinone reductase family protein [Acidimicrobiales bacterium]
MPSDLALKIVNRSHRALARLSGGRIGWSINGMPVVQLTTTGRRSGAPRTSMLTSPYQEGSTVVVVASRGGDDRHPAWYLNVLDRPEVQAAVAGKPAVAMTAVVANEAERARLWPLVTGKYPHYAGYQRKTSREIPLVKLTRVGP